MPETDHQRDPAAPEPIGQVVAVPVQTGHPHGQPAETRSETERHLRDLQLPVAADTAAAAAETTPGPAAIAAAAAWVAAATAAVVTVVAVAVADSVAAEEAVSAAEGAVVAAEDAAVEDVGDNLSMEEKTMKSKFQNMTSSKILVISGAILTSAVLTSALIAAPEKKDKAAMKEDSSAEPASGQKQFDTPKQAADALIQVAANFDAAAAKEILGPDSEDIVSSEDPVADKNRALEFANKAKEKNSVDIDKQNPNHAILLVGKDDFPLPIPIVKQKGKWFFDTKVGREEILNRRVGANELNTIEICRGFVEAQHEYAQEKHDDSKVNQYAQKIISTEGKHDGLAWKNPDGTWSGPVGDEVARAIAEGYSAQGKPYHGYYFKVLKGQGPNAPMGEMDFVVGGAMIGGFALAAAPAEYRVTGVKTFMVGPDGIVYEKDLGPDTLKTFQSMDKYNPDKTWQETADDVEDDSTDQGSG